MDLAPVRSNQSTGAPATRATGHGSVEVHIGDITSLIETDHATDVVAVAGYAAVRLDAYDGTEIEEADNCPDMFPSDNGGSEDVERVNVPRRIDLAEQTDMVGGRPVDGETGDGAPETMELAGKGCDRGSDRREPRAGIPRSRWRGVDQWNAEHVAPAKVGGDRLQAARAGNLIAFIAQAVDQHHYIAAAGDIGAEIRRSGVGRRVVMDGRVECRNVAYAAEYHRASVVPELVRAQGDTAAYPAVDRLIDVDVAVGIEFQRMPAAPGHRVIDEDVAVSGGGAAAAEDGHAVIGEVGRQV